jgi:hypothetical protein
MKTAYGSDRITDLLKSAMDRIALAYYNTQMTEERRDKRQIEFTTRMNLIQPTRFDILPVLGD